MKISINKTFENRAALDTYVRNTFGDNAENNKDIILEDTPDNLSALSLSEDITVFGVKIALIKEEANESPAPVLEANPQA